MKTSAAIFLCACSFLRTVAGEELLRQGWDALLPGTEVRGLTEKKAGGSSSKEARIYVGNAVSVSGPNSLCYDFRDIAPKERHGYSVVDLPPVGARESELQFCFLHRQGRTIGEIRGFYRRPGQGNYGVKTPWSFLNIVLDGVLSVNLDGRPKSAALCVGDVRQGVWHRLTIRIPAPDAPNAVGLALLERRISDGSFVKAGEIEVPFGELQLKEVKFFDLYGHGPCRCEFDDFVWSARP